MARPALEHGAVEGLSRLRCLVAGGAGFIGSSLVRVLLNSGAEVVVYDNLATGKLENLEGCAADTGREPEWRYGDVRDAERLTRMLPGCDVVFNLACLGVRHSIHSPHENHDVNARGALVLLTAARAARVPRFVHVSSSEVYGTARTVPMREDHPTDPHTVYGAGKLAGECYARAFFRCYGFGAVVVRPFNAYGPRAHHEGDSGEVIPRFLLNAVNGRPLVIFGDGTQTRDFTHVYDTAAALARAAAARDVEGETFNVGSGAEMSIRDLAEMVRRIAGTPDLPIEHTAARPGDVLRLLADSAAARRRLQHESSVTIEDGLADLHARLRAAGPEAAAAAAAGMFVRNWE